MEKITRKKKTTLKKLMKYDEKLKVFNNRQYSKRLRLG